MRKVNECPKGIGIVSNFINFLGENKNVIDILIDFYILYRSVIKTFPGLQLHSILFYWM